MLACGRLSPAEQKALSELSACRTAALGGHAWSCRACGQTRAAYNSCRNRHCPTCGGRRRRRWLDRLREDLLPVPHFHLVFTLPQELSALALGNRRAVYGLLFHSAWEALRTLAADRRHLGGQAGAVMVLHTWGQNLQHHPHVHSVVPGGALAPGGDRWIPARTARFLLPVKALSRLFRGKFLAGLKKLHAAGELKLGGALAELADRDAFNRWLTPLYQREWVVYCQPPPAGLDASAVLKYLARYIAGAAIGDGRLIAHARGRVTFRAKNYRRGRASEALTLSGVEFVRRFLLHVLPQGLARVRYYGLLSNARRTRLIPRCRELLGARAPAAANSEPPAPQPAGEADSEPRCLACGSTALVLVEEAPRPPWRELLKRLTAAAPFHDTS